MNDSSPLLREERKCSPKSTMSANEDDLQPANYIKVFNVSGAIFLVDTHIFSSYPDTLLGSEQIEEYYIPSRDEYFVEHHKHIFSTVIRFYTHDEELAIPPCIPKEMFEEGLKFYRLLPYFQGVKTMLNAAPERAPLNIREKVLLTIIDPNYSIVSKIYAVIDLLIIILSTVILVLESVPELQKLKQFPEVSWSVEVFVNIYFTLQAIILLAAHKPTRKYFKNWNNWVDMISVMPFYVKIVAKSFLNQVGGLRVLRLIRLLRILKLFRHSQGSQSMVHFLYSSLPEIMLLLLMWSMGVMLFGPLIYFIEKDGKEFTSAFSGMWFCVVTIGTVGYGDLAPSTSMGKLLAGLYAILNLTIMTIPISIIITKFSRSKRLYKK